MSHVRKFGISILLGGLAAALNWMWLSAEKVPPMFVATSAEVLEGDILSDELLMAIPVPGNREQLRSALIPYENRSVLFGSAAPRPYLRGDVIFQRDLEVPNQRIRLQSIGPFQLVSVGSRKKELGDGVQDYSGVSSDVTIAVDRNFDGSTSELLDMLASHSLGKRKANHLKIIAVQVIPDDSPERLAEPIAPENIVYQTISLAGVPNVPSVLLEGKMIRFVVPAEVKY
jgi:hypothetical protein